MSGWRRSALHHLPSCRVQIERATTPDKLWTQLASIVSSDRSSGFECEQTVATFRYAAECLASPTDAVRRAVVDRFYPLALTHWSQQLHLVVRESEWPALESSMAQALSREQLAAAREDFYSGLAALDDPSAMTQLRRLKNRLLDGATEVEREGVEKAWESVVVLLDVGETALGIEIFADNLDEAGVTVAPVERKRLEELAAEWGASIP